MLHNQILVIIIIIIIIIITPKGWSQSVTHEKQNTKQSNANAKLERMWYLFEILVLHQCIRKSNSETKNGRNITQSAVMKRL